MCYGTVTIAQAASSYPEFSDRTLFCGNAAVDSVPLRLTPWNQNKSVTDPDYKTLILMRVLARRDGQWPFNRDISMLKIRRLLVIGEQLSSAHRVSAFERLRQTHLAIVQGKVRYNNTTKYLGHPSPDS